jgi:hypothetical protein
MTAEKTKNTIDTFAILISVVFHPLFVPVYGMIMIFSTPALLAYLPFEVKRLIFLIVLINNVVLPFSLVPFFRYKNIISSWSLENRHERIIPLIITSVLYSATSYIIFSFPLPTFFKSFIFALLFISLTVTVINFWWKISIHSVGAGAFLALIIVLSVRINAPMSGYLISSVIGTGLLLSSRLELNSHNPGQVWFGLLTGFAGLSLFMMIFE